MKLKHTDLRNITYFPERSQTNVVVQMDEEQTVDWLLFGEATLRTIRTDGVVVWRLEGLMGGTTDPHHDSAYALRLPLVALEFSFIHAHCALFHAMVSPLDPEEFRVPLPGYNPRKGPDVITCQRCENRHLIVPEGFYVPSFNQKLYDLVVGKKVSITIGRPSSVS